MRFRNQKDDVEEERSYLIFVKTPKFGYEDAPID